MAEVLQRAKKETVEILSQMFQALGFPRSTGLIYGLLYVSPKALTLEDICDQVLITKGSASTGTRKLSQLKAIQTVWVPGDRRPYFQCVDDTPTVFASIVKEFLDDRLGRSGMWANLEAEFDKESSGPKGESDEFYRGRLRNLLKIRERLRKAGPRIEEFLRKS